MILNTRILIEDQLPLPFC